MVPLRLPVPGLSLVLGEDLPAGSEYLDTADLSLHFEPDAFAFGLESMMELPAMDPDPVDVTFDFVVPDVQQAVSVALPPVPITIPSVDHDLPLMSGLTPGPQSIPMDLGAHFATATFATGTDFVVTLSTTSTASLENVRIRIRDGAGTALASSGASVNVGAAEVHSLSVPMGGVTLPSEFAMVVEYDAYTGDGDPDELNVHIAWRNAAVTSATGVDAASVTPVTFSHSVLLSGTGLEITEAQLRSGTAVITSFSSGSLELTPSFDGDLAGLRIGGSTPSSLAVGGTVGPPSEASTVDVSTTADLGVSFQDLTVDWLVLPSASFDATETTPLEVQDSTIDALESVVVDSGSFTLDIVNSVGLGGPLSVTVLGARGPSGETVTTSEDIAAAAPGAPATTAVVLDLDGVTLYPDSLAVVVAVNWSGTDVYAEPGSGVSLDPAVSLTPGSFVLDGTPDISMEVDQRTRVGGDLDLSELEDLLGGMAFNDVTFTVSVQNGTGIGLRVAGFGFTLEDSYGHPILDDAGVPVAIALQNDPSGDLVIGPDATSTVQADAASFSNAVMDALVAEGAVYLRAGGTAGADQAGGSLSRSDSIHVSVSIVVQPDISLPAEGVEVHRVIHEAIQLDSALADVVGDLSSEIEAAALELAVLNGVPVGLGMDIAMAPTPSDTAGFDPFDAPDRVEITGVQVDPAVTDSTGAADSPTATTAEVSVNPADLEILREAVLDVAVRFRLIPPPDGRVRIQPGDSVILAPTFALEVVVGGTNAGGSQ